MQIRITVPGNQIVARGRLICRLKGCSHTASWRRAASGTWLVTQVHGVRVESGMQYTLDLERRDPATLGAVALADFSCLEGFEITVPEKRPRRSTGDSSSDHGSPGTDADSSDAAATTDPASSADTAHRDPGSNSGGGGLDNG